MNKVLYRFFLITITMATIPADNLCAGTINHTIYGFCSHTSDFGAISVMEGSCAVLISKVESHMDVNTLKLSGIVSTYLGGVCGLAVNTSNSGSGGPGFKPRPSRCFLRQETLLHFVSLQPGA